MPIVYFSYLRSASDEESQDITFAAVYGFCDFFFYIVLFCLDKAKTAFQNAAFITLCINWLTFMIKISFQSRMCNLIHMLSGGLNSSSKKCIKEYIVFGVI